MSVSWKASLPMNVRRDLPGDAHHRDRIEHRGRDPCDEVRRPGTGRRHADADPARGARVPVGHVRGALLVANEDVADRRLEHRVVRGHDRPAGVAEDDLDPFASERLPENLCAGALFRRRSCCSSFASTGQHGRA